MPIAILFFMLALPSSAQDTGPPDEDSIESGFEQAASVESSSDEASDEITATEIEEVEAIEADMDGSLDDSINSIDAKRVLEGVGVGADIRVGYFDSDIDDRDGGEVQEDIVVARRRIRTEFAINEHLRIAGRVAGICSSEECNPNVVLEDSIPSVSGMQDGDITLDQAYFQRSRLDRFDIAIGRMRTKFVSRGGVFSKTRRTGATRIQ